MRKKMKKICAMGIIAVLLVSSIGVAMAAEKIYNSEKGWGEVVYTAKGGVALDTDKEVIANNAAIFYEINPDGTKEVTKIVNFTDLTMGGYAGYMISEYANGTVIEKALTEEELEELREGRHNVIECTTCNVTDTQSPAQIYHRVEHAPGTI